MKRSDRIYRITKPALWCKLLVFNLVNPVNPVKDLNLTVQTSAGTRLT